MNKEGSNKKQFDVIIVGAGISGIDAAYHLQTKCPSKSYSIFEGRANIGGTWDLFKYPGIRSDSDMYTFSFSFKPWEHPKAISEGSVILDYLNETVKEFNIEKNIKFNHLIQNADWSSENKEWTITVNNSKTKESLIYTCNFFFVCSGYYDYEEGYSPDFKGSNDFKGEIVHPQKWTSDIEYANKKVVVIGSGATAITLVPTLAEKAEHVVMLQRSPTYIFSMPSTDKVGAAIKKVMPSKAAHWLIRWKNILFAIYTYNIARKKPKLFRNYWKKQLKKELGETYDINTHFNPSYNPWDQRLCVVPDGDLFKSIKAGKTSVVTNHISHFEEEGIVLKTGEKLEADLIVTATGLKLKFGGGIIFRIDGKQINSSDLLGFKGLMFRDVPNLAFVVGYTNASWTLKADLVCNYVCRLLNHMDKNNKSVCIPRHKGGPLATEPAIDFTSGYVTRAENVLPKQGSEFPWKLHQNYIKDTMLLKHSKIDDGFLEFS